MPPVPPDQDEDLDVLDVDEGGDDLAGPPPKKPLDSNLAEQLFRSRYKQQLQNVAYKEAWRHDSKDPQELYSELLLKVWMKAVLSFDMSKVKFTTQDDVVRAFNTFFTTILQQYIASLTAHRDTGKQRWKRDNESQSADQPVTRGDEGEGASILDLVGDERDPHANAGLQQLLTRLPSYLSKPLQFILEEYQAGATGEIFQQIRAKGDAGDADFQDPKTPGKGWTKTRLINALLDDDNFNTFLEERDKANLTYQ